MGYIFEAEITSIIQTVLIRTIGEGDSIRLRDVAASEIHPALKAYVKAEVEKLLQQERQKEVRSKRFPYSLPEIDSLQRQIDLLLIQEYEFTRGEFEATIDEAVHFQFNYLCRPQWTLMSFIFENKRKASAEDIERKLRYCVEYPYFPKLIKRYFVDRGLAEVSYEEFRFLLEKIDREVTSRHSPHELARMTRPLLSFLEAGQLKPKQNPLEHTLPVNAAIVFFEDKKLDDIKSELERRRDTEGREQISVSELGSLIESIRVDRSQEQPTPSLIITNPEPQEKPVSELRDAQLSEATVEQITGASPPLDSGKSEETIIAREVEEGPRIDLYTLFSSADRKLFVRKLFHKNEAEFRNALDSLERLRTWEEASRLLDQIFQANNIDPFSKEAILFTDLVHSRYKTSSSTRSALGS
ncbi:MAG TPA: hypothetical protein VNN76_11480 [Bacteroidota bacterium]|nr:hypothetical protein [Bacteroidota bacterium]